jgi:hypothetical protein
LLKDEYATHGNEGSLRAAFYFSAEFRREVGAFFLTRHILKKCFCSGPEAAMKRLFAIATLLIGLVAPCGTFGAEPLNDITTADAIAIRTVVQSQLEALAEDDATSAFELTTPTKRMQIGTADNFLRMIKEEYTPIYRPRLALFSSPQVIDGNAIQIVRITGDDRHVWVAIFWMLQDEDSEWKIDGCQLLETTSLSI